MADELTNLRCGWPGLLKSEGKEGRAGNHAETYTFVVGDGSVNELPWRFVAFVPELGPGILASEADALASEADVQILDKDIGGYVVNVKEAWSGLTVVVVGSADVIDTGFESFNVSLQARAGRLHVLEAVMRFLAASDDWMNHVWRR